MRLAATASFSVTVLVFFLFFGVFPLFSVFALVCMDKKNPIKLVVCDPATSWCSEVFVPFPGVFFPGVVGWKGFHLFWFFFRCFLGFSRLRGKKKLPGN